MKVLRFNPNEESPKLFTLQFNFEQETGVLSGTVGTTSSVGDNIKEFSIDLNKWKGVLIEAVLVTTNLGYEVAVYNALKNFSMLNGLPEAPKNRSRGVKRLFRVAVHENLNESIIQITQGHEEVDGFENVIEEGDSTLQLYNLCQKDPLVNALAQRVRSKSAMLGKIDQRDSVSYLEAQVDLLTRLYLEDHPDKTDELTELLKQANQYSVLDIKSNDKVLDEFVEKKALVRQVQKEFYAERLNAEATVS